MQGYIYLEMVAALGKELSLSMLICWAGFPRPRTLAVSPTMQRSPRPFLQITLRPLTETLAQVKVDLSEEEAKDAAARRAAMQGGPDKSGQGMRESTRQYAVRGLLGSDVPAPGRPRRPRQCLWSCERTRSV